MPQPSEETTKSLNTLLDKCEALAFGRHLRPYHMVGLLKVSGTVQEAIIDLMKRWDYKPNPEARLILKELPDWKAEINDAPFFWAGFRPLDQNALAKFTPPSETEEHMALRSAFIEMISGVFSPDLRAYRLSSEDGTGRGLCSYGGLHDYFVLVEGASGLLIDFDWDS